MKYNPINIEDKIKAQSKFDYLMNNNKRFELKEIKNKRTISQNAYLHVVIDLYSIEFGYTSDESKTHLKRKCDYMRYEKNNEVFLKKTSKMDTKELTTFIEWIRNYSSMNGCYIPSSEEYLLNKFTIDKSIDVCRQYL